MKIDYSKKSKVSFLLSTMLLGAVSLSASVGTVLNNQTLEIDNNYKLNMYYLSNNSQLINKGSNDNSLNIEESIDSSIINNSSLNVIDDWTAINAKKIENSQIINNGNINILGDSSNYVDINGIDVLNLVDSRVVNKGNIISNLNSDATVNGIVVRDAQGSSIKNTGTINLKATGDDLYLQGIHLDGYFASQNSTSANFNNSEIINDKDILVSSEGKLVSSYGITSYDFNINDSQIINNGTISVSSKGVIADSAGMELDSLNNSQIINKGTIKANSTVINNSEDESFADSFAILIDHSNKSKIENNGNILVNSNKENEKLTAYAEAISIEEANSLTLENSGTIKSTINNKLDKEAVAILFVNSDKSTVLNKAGGEIHGSVILYGDTTFNNKGSIYLPYNANSKTFRTFDDNDGKGEQTISFQPNFGNFTNSGTIEIGAFKNKNDIIENTQILTKTATFDTGSKMQVAVVEGSKAFVKGDTLSKVVTATDKLTINDLTLNQTKLADNSATLDFKYEIKNNSLDLVVSKVNSFSEAGNTRGNATIIAQTLDKLRTDPTLGSLVAKLDTLDAAALNRALDTLTPTIAAAISNTSSQISTSVLNVVSSRNRLGANSGDEMVLGNSTLWSKVYGSLGEQKEKDGINGFDLKTYGLGLGYENEYKDGQLLGAGLFYTNANVDINGVSQKTDVDAYSIALYGNNLLKDNKTTIYYQGAYTWQKNDSKRDLFDGTQANAKFTTKILSLDLGVGHKININESLHMEPKLGVTYKHYSNPNYSETGSSANITTNKFTSSELLGNAELNMGYKINDFSKITALAGVGYDFKNDNNIVTSSFSAAPSNSFDTKGIDNGRWKYVAGLGYDVDVNNQNNINLSYNFQGEGSKYTNHGLALNYRYKF